MKILINLINFIIIIKVCLLDIITVSNSSFKSENCSNNLKFNLTINPHEDTLANIHGKFKNESGNFISFTCNNASSSVVNLICELDDSLENGIYNISSLYYSINNASDDNNEKEANIDSIVNYTLNYAKNYATIDEILTQNQTIYFDYSTTFKIFFQTINVERNDYKINLIDISNNKSEKFTLNESNITCNLGIMYIKLNSNDFNLKVNDTKNYSVYITNPCDFEESYFFNITLNKFCENCSIETTNLNETSNITNPFFDESFYIFKSKFYFFLNILLLLFL